MGEDKSWPTEERGAVVVGVDGSSGSRTALEWAAAEAADRRAGLVVLHAGGDARVGGPHDARRRVPSMPEATDESDPAYAATVARISPGLAVRTESPAAEPSEALVAASRRAALVVVGSRRLGALRSSLPGAVSLRVSGYAECPVAVVPSGVSPKSGGPIAVGVDGSADSEAALRFALEEAALRGVRLTAVLVRTSSEAVGALTADAAGSQAGLRQAERQVHRMLDEARTEHTARVGARVRVVVRRDHPADALLDVARAADMIVVGSRGMGGIRGRLLGSVSQEVLRRSPVPVVVARVPSA